MNRKQSTGVNGSVEGMDVFYTAERAAAGIKLPLSDPLGRKTKHWLRVIGTDSEEFRIYDSATKRIAVEIASLEDDTERAKATMKMTRDLVARLVKEWSFEEPCTHENVVKFFEKAPQIQRSVDAAAASRSLFYRVESSNSSKESNTNSG